jgi:hypothetical protein
MPVDLRADLLDPDTAEAVGVALGDLGRPLALTPVTAGTPCTAYRADLPDGTAVIVKTGPHAVDRLLAQEHELLRTEAMVCRTAERRPGLLLPRVRHADLSRSVVPFDVLVTTGSPVLEHRALARRTAVEREHRLGVLMADLHTITGDRFGLPGEETAVRGDTWAEALGRSVATTLADGRRWGVELPEAEVWAALDRHQDALATVDRPVLVHGDLRPGVLRIDPGTGDLTGVTDPGRALFADPLWDVAAAEPAATGPASVALLAGYTAGGGRLDAESTAGAARLALCRMALRLMLRVETALRAAPGDRQAAARADALLALALADLA